jgi:hypothetical protein
LGDSAAGAPAGAALVGIGRAVGTSVVGLSRVVSG